jgi:iron complex outermembrane receptor protein
MALLSTQSIADPSIDKLKQLSLEELSQTSIALTSKKEKNLEQVASAAYVITQEDIRRSGATSLPELLRGVPGLNVAQVDANQWAVSARGFSGLFSNKMLVMIDGRSIYDPLFAGVYWSDHDLILPDVKKIEIIRGPGATLWGANAVNGVINIVTKSSKETQGTLLQAGIGDYENNIVGLRYGGKLTENGSYRIFAKYRQHDDFVNLDDDSAHDAATKKQLGFRVDLATSENDQLFIKGEINKQDQDITRRDSSGGMTEPAFDNVDTQSGYLQADWQHRVSVDEQFKLGLSYFYLDKKYDFLEQKKNTFELDLQHEMSLKEGFDLIWGASYRYVTDDLSDHFSPTKRNTQLFGAFIQADLSYFDDFLLVNLGSKLEHNDFTGYEIQPSAHALLDFSPQHKVWGAVSRAVRTPSRSNSDFDLDINGGPGVTINVQGSDDVDAEELIAYEAGYRFIPSDRFKFEVAAYYNEYDKIETHDTLSPEFGMSGVTIPVVDGNNAEGDTYGIELSAEWQVMDKWRIQPSYTWSKCDLNYTGNSTDFEIKAGSSPEHQFALHSYMSLPLDTEFDLHWYYVDGESDIDVPSYHRMNVRLGWQPNKHLEFSVVGRNLLDSEHIEAKLEQDGGIISSQIERSIYAQVNLRF